MRRLIIVLAVSLAGLAAGPVRGLGADIPPWPSAQAERLRELESEVLDLQRQLSAARHGNRPADVERLEKEFKELQGERGRLLRATGQLP